MNIGIDLDGVLADTMTMINEYYNTGHGTNFILDDYRQFELRETWKCTREDALKKIDEFFFSDYFKTVIPVSGAVEGINALSGGHKLFVITARPGHVQEETRNWLSRHYGNKFSGIFFTNEWRHENSGPRSKQEMCSELGIDVLIEDSLENAMACNSDGIKIFLLDRPWNRTEEEIPANIIRAYSWDEIVELLVS
jgi:uncharacterized HAD superfamily protein